MPLTFQTGKNNSSINYFLMAHQVAEKLLQYKFNGGNLLHLCALEWFHGIIMSSFISPKILSKQAAVSCGTHFQITYYNILFCYTKFGAFITK